MTVEVELSTPDQVKEMARENALWQLKEKASRWKYEVGDYLEYFSEEDKKSITGAFGMFSSTLSSL